MACHVSMQFSTLSLASPREREIPAYLRCRRPGRAATDSGIHCKINLYMEPHIHPVIRAHTLTEKFLWSWIPHSNYTKHIPLFIYKFPQSPTDSWHSDICIFAKILTETDNLYPQSLHKLSTAMIIIDEDY